MHFFISYQQNNWPNWLSNIQFFLNNYFLPSTNIDFFFANYGYYSTIGIEPAKMIDKTPTTQRFKLYIENTNKFTNKINKLYYFFYKEITYI